MIIQFMKNRTGYSCPGFEIVPDKGSKYISIYPGSENTMSIINCKKSLYIKDETLNIFPNEMMASIRMYKISVQHIKKQVKSSTNTFKCVCNEWNDTPYVRVTFLIIFMMYRYHKIKCVKKDDLLIDLGLLLYYWRYMNVHKSTYNIINNVNVLLDKYSDEEVI